MGYKVIIEIDCLQWMVLNYSGTVSERGLQRTANRFKLRTEIYSKLNFPDCIHIYLRSEICTENPQRYFIFLQKSIPLRIIFRPLRLNFQTNDGKQEWTRKRNYVLPEVFSTWTRFIRVWHIRWRYYACTTPLTRTLGHVLAISAPWE